MDSYFLFSILLPTEFLVLFFLSRIISQDISVLLFKLTRSKAFTIRLLALFFLPGVMVHESAHYLAAIILGVKVHRVEFMPQIQEGDRVKLGSVQISSPDHFRRFLIGVAPLFVGVALIILAYYAYFSITFAYKTALLIYIVFQIGNTMFSSKRDMEGSLWLFLALAIICCLVYLFSPFVWHQFLLLLHQYTNYIKQMDIIVALPVGIDIGIILLTSLFLRRG